jgi:hypothetical protein
MTDLHDVELRRPHEPSPEPPPRSVSPALVGAVLLIIAAAVAAWFVLRGPEPAQPEATQAAAPVEGAAPRPLGGPADDIVVPPLDETDPLVRQLVAALSSHPQLAAWLATDNLVRTFTLVVHDVAAGTTPSRRLKVLSPGAPLRVVDQSEEVVVLDRASYARYNAFADAVASVDAPGAARLYATLKPRIEEAHREYGYPDTPFDQTLETAIVHLLRTPVVDREIALEPKGGVGYGFADPRLEALSPAQKQLLRMGPRNVRLLQAKLREIGLALGIPAERLPVS